MHPLQSTYYTLRLHLVVAPSTSPNNNSKSNLFDIAPPSAIYLDISTTVGVDKEASTKKVLIPISSNPDPTKTSTPLEIPTKNENYFIFSSKQPRESNNKVITSAPLQLFLCKNGLNSTLLLSTKTTNNQSKLPKNPFYYDNEPKRSDTTFYGE